METVVLDSNIAIATIVEVPYTQAARKKISQWAIEDIDLAAPSLWEYEIVSVLRKYASSEIMDKDSVYKALDQIFSLNVLSIRSTLEGHRNALQWAEKLNDYVAYDAQYLAVAEQLEAEFWTADRRLVLAAQNAGAAWVHWLGDG